MKKLTIKSWAIDDRPREKLVRKGKTNLSDAELIAILIASGNRDENAVALSQRILKSVNNSLHKLSQLSINELLKFKGIGKAKAVAIITALELGKRRFFEPGIRLKAIQSSVDVFHVFQPIMSDLLHEEFWVLFLNNANQIIGKQQLSKGGMTSTLVDIRLVFKQAFEVSAVALIIVHNHPSNKVTPSHSDIQITDKIKQAGTTLDIKLLDHLILAEKAYFSFADEGIL